MNPEEFLASLQGINIQQSPNTFGGGAATLPSTTEAGFFDQGGGFGNVMAGFNALSGLTNAYGGLKQLGLAEDTFKFNKDAFNTNLGNQATSINSENYARQQRQNDATGTQSKYSSLDDYIKNSPSAVSGTIGG